MSGVVYPLLLLTLPIEAPAGAPANTPQDPELISPESVMETTLLMLGEVDQRLTVPVAVNAKGPYNFIIDTGAERTVVSRELANTLRLSSGAPVTLLSMTGRSQVDTVLVPDLMIKSIGVQHSVIAPKLEARNLGAIGLLGIDTLRDHQVTIDFDNGTMEVRPSQKSTKRRRNAPDEIVVTAKSQFGQLIVTDAYYGSTRIQVVLDTGSQVSMGNSALRKRVGRSRRAQAIELTDVTGEKATAGYTTVPNIKVGDVMFGSMPVAFADVAPFERFGLTKRPALLLGMDALRSFRRVDIDFPNRQVRFRMPKGSERRLGFGTGSLLGGGSSPGKSY
ncbi:retroviral-like aspartic protease family protein [Sphingomonas sp. HF-S4]|uniref:Retroviral-like aspartic protease family protein n=1 Tax=Sphingomonas agrestis TaxID=3080540 RepID=A0ABU3YBS9_9SPHN|nr:retroviral-like aspartic protease family protein [Sphingomonas sp. HF-S4]MDV3458856.1 retroviral-like aspartic protease family protein [Sphingomonas sp. HF-S4]